MINYVDQNSNLGSGSNFQLGVVLVWSLRIQYRELKLFNILLGLIIFLFFFIRIYILYVVIIIFIFGNLFYNSLWQILNIYLIIGGFILGYNNLFG